MFVASIHKMVKVKPFFRLKGCNLPQALSIVSPASMADINKGNSTHQMVH